MELGSYINVEVALFKAQDKYFDKYSLEKCFFWFGLYRIIQWSFRCHCQGFTAEKIYACFWLCYFILKQELWTTNSPGRSCCSNIMWLLFKFCLFNYARSWRTQPNLVSSWLPHSELSLPKSIGFPGGSDGKESTCNVTDPNLIPGSERSPGEGKATHPLVSLPGKSRGWRSLPGYSPWGRKVSDMTERLHSHFLSKSSGLLFLYTFCL